MCIYTRAERMLDERVLASTSLLQAVHDTILPPPTYTHVQSACWMSACLGYVGWQGEEGGEGVQMPIRPLHARLCHCCCASCQSCRIKPNNVMWQWVGTGGGGEVKALALSTPYTKLPLGAGGCSLHNFWTACLFLQCTTG